MNIKQYFHSLKLEIKSNELVNSAKLDFLLLSDRIRFDIYTIIYYYINK